MKCQNCGKREGLWIRDEKRLCIYCVQLVDRDGLLEAIKQMEYGSDVSHE